MKKALITGISGQDGSYLAQLLLEKGYKVYGADRRRVDSDYWRLKYLGINNDVEHVYMDLLEYSNIFNVIKNINPDEIYNLGAQSFVGSSFSQPILTSNINSLGCLRILESIRIINPECKFYQASTSEMFGKVQEVPQNEETTLYPRSPYGVSKVYSHYMVKNYRESYNLFACSGILFNHESPLRGREFVTKKITSTVARIKYGLEDKLSIGNLEAKRDWGFAKDYVKGMYLMLQAKSPDDFVLSTGKTVKVRDFVEKSFKYVGIDICWEGTGINERGIDSKTGNVLIEINEKFFRPAEVDLLLGDSSKAEKVLGWKAETDLDELIKVMMEFDLINEK